MAYYGATWHPYWNPLYLHAMMDLRRTFGFGMLPFRQEDPTYIPIDWRETTGAHIFSAAFPGARKEDIRVKVEDNRFLTISSELEGGKVVRKFRLPPQVNVEGITAKFEDGVLSVVVPKNQRAGFLHINPSDIEDQHTTVANAA